MMEHPCDTCRISMECHDICKELEIYTYIQKRLEKNSMTEKYWYCYVYGDRAPRMRHKTVDDAIKEAIRITESQGKQVEILECVAISKVSAAIVYPDTDTKKEEKIDKDIYTF